LPEKVFSTALLELRQFNLVLTTMQLKHWQSQRQKQQKSPAAPKKVRRQKARRQALRQKLHTL
jgi:hypothetical protein